MVRARNRRRVPDLVRILLDQAVDRKTANMRYIQNRFAIPLLFVLIGRIHGLLAFHTGVVIRKQHVVIASRQKRIDDGREERAISRREITAPDHLERLMQFRIGGVNRHRVVAFLPERPELLISVSEQEDILPADRVGNLVIGAVMGGDRERPVQRELHIAGARRLGARHGNLFRKIARRNEVLGRLDVVIGNENDLQQAFDSDPNQF